MWLLKKFTQVILQPIIRKRIQRRSIYTWKDITLHIPSGIFHPAYFFSAKFLLNHVLELELSGKTFLELGAGNGLISIAAAKKNAVVTASDINENAVLVLQENAKDNNVAIQTIHSDLFESIPKQNFNFIAINPPYYPKNARNSFEQAWFCGENFEYFENLFSQISDYIDQNSITQMVLSQDCDLERIQNIAVKYGFTMHLAKKKRIYWEMNYIFDIRK